MILSVICCTFRNTVAQKESNLQLLEVQKIWDKAPHNAFTDLIRFQNQWFCVFRESENHLAPDGTIRVITSKDGQKWKSAANIKSPNSDLRDAKITITPQGQLMLMGAEALHDKSFHTHQSLAWFSDDGFNWSEKFEIGDPDFWLWRATWHKGKAFGIGYGCNKDKWVILYASSDGKNFTTIVDHFFEQDYPNETSLVFKGDTAFCLLRRDRGAKTGLIGISTSPYNAWQWKDLRTRIGGPDMILMPDGRLLSAVRLYSGSGWSPARTSLCWIDPVTGYIKEALTLPSGGDTSYAGMVLFNNLLWVSYYSSHEGKTSIYLAKVKYQ